MVDGIVIDPNRCTKGLSVIGTAGKHHVSPVVGTEWLHARKHVNVIICPRTIHGDERLSAKSYSIYPALDEVATQVNLNDLVKGGCLVPVLSVARAKAPKRAPSSANKEIAVRVHVECSGIGAVWKTERSLPGDSSVSGSTESAGVASKEFGPKLVLEPVSHTGNILIDSEPFLVTSMRALVGCQFGPGLAAGQ